MQITSKNNEKIKALIRLRDNKEREEKKAFLIEGLHMLEMALRSQKVLEVYATSSIDNLPSDIPFYLVSEEVMKKISHLKSPQGVVAKCQIDETHFINTDKILYLDHISDPGNLGTILRTALAFNYFNIILSLDCVSIYNEKVLMATQGALFSLNIIHKDYQYLNKLKEENYQIIATSLHDAKNLEEVNIPLKSVIVLGNEGQGVRKEILSIANQKVFIPIQNIDSLNVGVACGIILYYFNK